MTWSFNFQSEKNKKKTKKKTKKKKQANRAETLTKIYSTAKETRKLVTFKLFEYLIISIPEFWFTYEVNRYIMNVL